MTKKVLVLTEVVKEGSGYTHLMLPILEGLSKMDYDIRVVGLGYTGWEYDYGFSISGAQTVQDGMVCVSNIISLWKPDVLVVGMDIPHHIKLLEHLRSAKKVVPYVAITPLENPPLTRTWAAALMQTDYTFFISELGADAAKQAGLSKVGHLQVAADTINFYPATPEEKEALRKDLGFDCFTILSVADNQERKNLWATLKIVQKLKEKGHRVKLVLVTREKSQVGHNLRDLCSDYNINKEVLILERGIPQEELHKLYAASDLYLATSKAEGLCIPVMEAMACGLQVVATNTGALTELLQNSRGDLIEPAYIFTDVWGNSLRAMIDIDAAVKRIEDKMINGDSSKVALEYVKERTIDIPVEQLNKVLKEVTHEKETSI